MSEVPQMEQHLHSIHCHLYLRTETIMFAVNCKQVGCPITRTYAHHGLYRIWDGTRDLSWDASRKVPGHLSCAEEQWTPSYRFLFIFSLLFFRQIAFIFWCVIKSQIELHKQEQERKIMYNVWQQFCPQVRLDMSFTFPQH